MYDDFLLSQRGVRAAQAVLAAHIHVPGPNDLVRAGAVRLDLGATHSVAVDMLVMGASAEQQAKLRGCGNSGSADHPTIIPD